MPEGPECTTIAKSLNEYCAGRTLNSIEILSGRYVRAPLANLDKILNQKIIKISNKGKFIYWVFDNKSYLFSTLGMSGVYSTTKGTHSRVRFLLDNSLDIVYNDVRNFGTLKVAGQAELDKKLKEIGPDMLNDPCSYEDFCNIIEKNGKKILGPFLLDQKKVSGIGNIYKAEICYKAAIDPSRTLSSLSETEIFELYNASIEILELALKCGGSSLRDYSDVEGKLGNFLTNYAQVYKRTTDRQGNPVVQASLGDGRTTWWCPNVQK